MLKLGSTYLIVKDFEKSIAFYEALLQMKVSSQNYNRWAQFDFGSCIALYNPEYDKELIKQGENLETHYSNEYLTYYKNRKIQYGNNFVLNFYVDDLNAEYERIKKLNIGEVTEILYLNIASPYYYFFVDDPDGNTIEITGNYNQGV
ncbi:VOC family protein [Abyssisolibacter fermentans]|uniref:VOC family protein n=1 Tax=Abyssisolibacter fermentans TaxID=1766203 RepID=UPI0008326EF8|nr:VOC family protein [Abyssisolibacter fermentans]